MTDRLVISSLTIGRTVKVTYTAGAGIGFNPKSSPDVIAPQIVEAVELNLKNPPEARK